MNNEKYLKLIETRSTSENFELLEVEPGITWKVIPLNPIQAAITGHLPLHLIKELAKIKDFKGNESDIAKELSPDEIVQFLEFCRDVLYTNVIEPKFSADGENGTIPGYKIPANHFQKFMSWVSGGGQIVSNSFRPGSDKTFKRRR